MSSIHEEPGGTTPAVPRPCDPPRFGRVGPAVAGPEAMRLLPWPGDGVRPSYLSTDRGDSFMSGLADGLERTQLAMAERTLRDADSAWTDRTPGTDLTGMVPHLLHALRDAVRVAGGLRERLHGSGPAVPGPSAEAGSTLAREIAWNGADGSPLFRGLPVTVSESPTEVVYRWPGEPVYVGTARRLLRRHLARRGMTGLADTAELVLSELVTNALRHATAAEDSLVETRFTCLPDGSLRIEVHDADPTRPELRAPGAEADSGRGLALVDALTGGRWGTGDRAGIGKTVWAECAPETPPLLPG
ncbi:ATP-binding protein [Streptomyces sp. NPDC020983]|uniref:ATP-binding protein n=1 Tax=Streptomyces sp. NPDC020983 TaxID=3365106 RepID=UPI003795B41B